ncbi:MAG TPA: glycosyltransferase family 2 protein [Lacibacter sp.]|nr:glycosyltransferase family 2 protein [Lacibacter sp.]
MQLSVIIVNYNVKYFLEQCLSSVQKAIQGIDAEVLVADNASADGSIEYLAAKFPGVQFISCKENIGFARANNKALQQAKGAFILFLNPDTILAENSCTQCMNFLQTHSGAGALGVRMVDGSGRFLPESKRGFPSSSASFYKLSGLSALFPRSKTFARYHLGYLDEHQTHKVDVLSGAFMMVRKELLQQTGGFDEDYFMYGEDIDLSYRLQQIKDANGVAYRNYYVCNTTILHFKGESTKKGSLNYVRQFYNAMLLFVKKHPQEFYNSLFTLFIRIAILLRGFMSWLGGLFRKTVPAVTSPEESFFVIGSAESVQSIAAMFPSLHIKGSAASIESAALSFKGVNAIVLCESETISFEQIIRFTEQWGRTYTIYVHAKGSKSLVSSSSKNKSGLVKTEH